MEEIFNKQNNITREEIENFNHAKKLYENLTNNQKNKNILLFGNLLQKLNNKIIEERIKKENKKLLKFYENINNNSILENIITYKRIKLSFGDNVRDYILIGEEHKVRNHIAYEKYLNLVFIPLIELRERKQCLDFFIENIIEKKAIFNRSNSNLFIELTENNVSLLRIKKFINEFKSPYIRIHEFDTRERIKNINISIFFPFFQNLLKIPNNNEVKIKSFEFIREYLDLDNDNLTKEKITDLFFKNNITKTILIKSLFWDEFYYTNNEEEKINIIKKVAKNPESHKGSFFNQININTKEFFNKLNKINISKIKLNDEFKNYIIQQTYNYLIELKKRIRREYDKIPDYIKNHYSIKPNELFEKLSDKITFMTDIYLFYRIFMNYGGKEKYYNGPCNNYSNKSIILGGDKHIENIYVLITDIFQENINMEEDFMTNQKLKLNIKYLEKLDNFILDTP